MVGGDDTLHGTFESCSYRSLVGRSLAIQADTSSPNSSGDGVNANGIDLCAEKSLFQSQLMISNT